MKPAWPNKPSTKVLLSHHNPASYKGSTCLMQLFGREPHIFSPLLVEHYFMWWSLKGRLHSLPPSLKVPKEQAHRWRAGASGRSFWWWKSSVISQQLHQIRVLKTVLQRHSSFFSFGFGEPYCSSGPIEIALNMLPCSRLECVELVPKHPLFPYANVFLPRTGISSSTLWSFEFLCMNTAVLGWSTYMTYLLWTHQYSLYTVWHWASCWVEKRGP